jgi:Cof subfamily protein (haloacid dehalogenase superfamily)
MSAAPDRTPRLCVLAADLDDTLLRSDHQLSPRTLDALRRWRIAGGHVVVATGRPTRSVAAALPPDLHDIPWITYNGAEIVHNGACVFADPITIDATRTIVELARSLMPESVVGLEVDGALYLNRVMARPAPYRVADLLDVAIRPAAKILLFHTDASAAGDLLAQLPPGTRGMVSVKYQLVQILAASADKAAALRFLVERWGLSMDNVVAFGDDVNDVDMVAAAGYGVAVANAVAEVLAVADCITLSNDEDGVAAVVERLLPALVWPPAHPGMVY